MSNTIAPIAYTRKTLQCFVVWMQVVFGDAELNNQSETHLFLQHTHSSHACQPEVFVHGSVVRWCVASCERIHKMCLCLCRHPRHPPRIDLDAKYPNTYYMYGT